MKVIHVVHSNAFAGVERHVAQLASAQAARGDDVVVIGGDQTLMRGAAAPDVVLRPATTVWQTLRAVRLAAREAPDVVHAHMTVAEAASVVGLVGTGVPVVATRHFGRIRGRNQLTRLLTMRLARGIAAQISISKYVAGRVEGKSVVVHPGVPVQPDAQPAAERDRVILVVQRLEAEKGTDQALRIFARSGLAHSGWRLAVAGTGAQRYTLGQLARDLGIDGQTSFLGHRSDIADLMRRSDVLIAPCQVEGLGLAVVEAMAAGLPVVAAAAGGHLETLAGVTGAVLYNPTSGVEDAAIRLKALALDEHLRDDLASELQRAQREHFTLARQAELTDAVYRSVQ